MASIGRPEEADGNLKTPVSPRAPAVRPMRDARMNMVLVNQEQVLALRNALPAVTKVWLQEVLGVSETTWRSLRDGRPIRQSTYDRLVARFERTPQGAVVGSFATATSRNHAASADIR